MHDLVKDWMCGVNESLLSRSMPRVLMESEVPTVVPATLTAATGSVNRALWAVLKWIASDLFGLSARPLLQNQV